MSSWRIKTSVLDLTQTVDTTPSIQGAVAIAAPKGVNSWVYWPQGSTQKILDTYGYASAIYPAIADAIDYNNVDGVWINAPNSGGTYGGVFVTTAGTIPFVSGTSTQSIANYAAISCSYQVGVATAGQTIFTATLPQFAYYNNISINLLKNGTSLNVTATDAATEVLSTSPNVGSGSYVRSTGVLTFTFSSGLTLGDIVTATYTINLSSIIYFTLYGSAPQSDDLEVLVTKDANNTGFFYMNVYRYSPVTAAYEEISDSPFYFGLATTSKDGNGNNVYIGNVFGSTQYIFTPVVQNSTFTTFTNDTVAVALNGGARGTSVTGAMLATAYSTLNDTNTYGAVEIVFDASADPEVAAAFETLRNGSLTRCRFMLPTSDASTTTIIATPLTYANNITDNRGIYYYCLTWGIHKDTYLGNDFNCSNMGLIASKMANVLLNGPGGNPAWVDDGTSNGGQLGSLITKLNQTASESDLQILDSLHFNPVIMHPTYGPMIASWRTRNAATSDYSYIPQSSLTDWILKLVEKQVLPLQIGKLNDVTHRNQVASSVTTIVGGLKKWLEDYLVICDESNNTSTILQQQKFVISLGVQYSPYSAMIIFNFVAGKQGISLKEQMQGM